MNLSSLPALFCVFPFLLMGFLLVYDGVKKYLLIQTIKNTPTSKVDSVPVGLAELAGKAIMDSAFLSPVSKTKCTYWRISAQYYQSGKNGGWRSIFFRDSANQFYIDDGTGKMLVDPKGGDITIEHDNMYEGYLSGTGIFGMSHEKIDQRVIDFINDPANADDNRKLSSYAHVDVRIYEYYIEDGDDLFIFGDVEEAGAGQETRSSNLVIRKGKSHNVLFITDSQEKRALNGLFMSALSSIGGGVLLILFCLFFVLPVILL